jgi:hypothetical protein
MRINEILTEAIDRRGFLKGLGGAAAVAAMPNLAKAGDYQPLEKLTKDPEALVNVWAPRLDELTARANKMLARLARAAGPQWAKSIEGTDIGVVSNEDYAQSSPEDRQIRIDLTVFWDADDATLAFVIAHELGHIALGHFGGYDKEAASPEERRKHAAGYRQQELDADSFAVRLAKVLGYNKAEVFKFMHKQKEQYAYLELLTKNPNSTHPTFQQRIQKAKQDGFQLSKGGIQQLNALATHLA